MSHSSTTKSSNMKQAVDSTNLYVKNIPKCCTQNELDDLFKCFGRILQSRVYGDGIGFVRFERPESAKRAIKELHGSYPAHCKGRLIVKYAIKNNSNDRISEEDEKKMTIYNKNNIYLRGFPQNFTKKQLRDLCEKYGTVSNLRIHSNQGYAFVRYENSKSAEIAIRNLNGKRFKNKKNNNVLFVKLANNDLFDIKRYQTLQSDNQGKFPKYDEQNSIPDNYMSISTYSGYSTDSLSSNPQPIPEINPSISCSTLPSTGLSSIPIQPNPNDTNAVLNAANICYMNCINNIGPYHPLLQHYYEIIQAQKYQHLNIVMDNNSHKPKYNHTNHIGIHPIITNVTPRNTPTTTPSATSITTTSTPMSTPMASPSTSTSFTTATVSPSQLSSVSTSNHSNSAISSTIPSLSLDGSSKLSNKSE